MKKSLLVVALLLFATTAYAVDVTVTATQGAISNPSDPNQLKPVSISFSGLAEDGNVAGFALVLTVDNGCNLDNIRDFNKGESTTLGSGKRGYGIFPGKFRDVVTPATADVCMATDGRYNPIAPWNDTNSQGGNDSPRMVVELGAVWSGDANKPATGGRGTLFTVDVNSEGRADCNMTVALEMTRGGIVKSDATAATATLPGTFKVTFAAPNCTEPNLVGKTMTDANSTLIAAGFATPPIITYEPNGMKTALTVDRQSPASGSVVACTTATSYVVDTNCLYVGRVFALYGTTTFTVTATHITNWNAAGRPGCMCCTSQKRGNGYYASTSATKTDALDLSQVKNSNNWNKATPSAANKCLDFNISGKVDAIDLSIVKNSNNWNKLTGSAPPCP